MHILALVTDAFGGRGGIARYNQDLLEAVAGAKSVSTITVLPRHAPDAVAAPDRIRQREPSSDLLTYIVKAVWISLTRRVDAVFCGHIFMAPLALVLARAKGAKLLFQMHGIEAWPRPTRLQRIAVESADLVFCISRATRARVAKWARLSPERIVALSPTVREEFTPGDGTGLRTRWGLLAKKVLLTVGRLDSTERYKGHDRVIVAMPSLIAAGHDVVFVVLGSGDDRERLEQLARACGVEERVYFMGAVGTATLIEAYRAADLFVMPSTGEGFGIVFLEAMACGAPALGLAIAGACDALGDGELGAAVSIEDFPKALARALEQARPDPSTLAAETRRRFGRDVFTRHAQTIFETRLQAGPVSF